MRLFKTILTSILISGMITPAHAAFYIPDNSVTTAKINTGAIHGLTAVTAVAADYVAIADASDSNKIKKAKFSDFKNTVYRSVTTTDAVGADDETMKLSGASFTSTIPTAVGVAGKKYKFVHAGTSLTQIYTLHTTSSQTIGGVADNLYILYTNGEVLVIESDGANWMVVAHQTATQEADAGALAVTASSAHSFTISSASITAGTTYSTPNGCKFVVSTTTVTSTNLLAYGTCAPNAASNTLTYVSGPTAGNRAYTAVSNTNQPVKGSVTYDRFIWARDGAYINFRYEYLYSGAASAVGSGTFGFWLPTNLQPDETYMFESTAVLGAAYPAGFSTLATGNAYLSAVNFTVTAFLMWPGLMGGVCSGGGVWSTAACTPMTSNGRMSIIGRYKVTGWQN